MDSFLLWEPPLCLCSPGEALLVRSMRYWVGSMKARLDPRDLVDHGFESADAGEAAGAFNAIMETTLREATSMRDVRRLACPTLGSAERDLLDAVAHSQHGRTAACMAILSTWLPAHTLSSALDHASAIGEGLRAAGLRLPKHGTVGRSPAVPAARPQLH